MEVGDNEVMGKGENRLYGCQTIKYQMGIGGYYVL